MHFDSGFKWFASVFLCSAYVELFIYVSLTKSYHEMFFEILEMSKCEVLGQSWIHNVSSWAKLNSEHVYF